MLRFDKATYLSLLLFYYILLFITIINIVSTLYKLIEFIILSYTFKVISFVQHKAYMTLWISFSKFSDVLPVLLLQELLVIFETLV